jgi:hypothetical protein
MDPLPAVKGFARSRRVPPVERKPKELHQMFVDCSSEDSQQVLIWLKQHKRDGQSLLRLELKLLSEKGNADSCLWAMQLLTEALTELGERVTRKEEWRKVMSQQIAWFCSPLKEEEAVQLDLQSADNQESLNRASDMLYSWTQLNWLDQDTVVAWVAEHNVTVLSDSLRRRLDSGTVSRHKRRKSESKQSKGEVDPELLTQRLTEHLESVNRQEQELSQQQQQSETGAMQYSPAYAATEPAYSPTSPAYSPPAFSKQPKVDRNADDDDDNPFSPAVSGLASPVYYARTGHEDNVEYSPIASVKSDDDVVATSAAVEDVHDAVLTPQSPAADSVDDDSIIMLDVEPTAAELFTIDACSLIRHVATACGYDYKELGAALNFFHHFQVRYTYQLSSRIVFLVPAHCLSACAARHHYCSVLTTATAAATATSCDQYTHHTHTETTDRRLRTLAQLAGQTKTYQLCALHAYY